MNKPKAIIFDMDGLMIDSERVTFESYVKVLKEEGRNFDLEFYKKLLGKTKQNIFQIFRDQYGQDFPIDEIYKRVHVCNNQEYDENGVPVKPGLIQLFPKLKEEQIPAVIATSSNRHRVIDILKRTGMEDYFEDMVCGDDIVHGKPDPEIFLSAAKKAGQNPEDCLVLEDSESGIMASKNANIPVICVVDLKYPEEPFSTYPEKIVSSLDEVCEELF